MFLWADKLKAKPTRGGVLIGVHLTNSASKRKASQRRPILSNTKIRGTRLSSQHSTSLNHCEHEGSWRRLVRDRAAVALTQAGCTKILEKQRYTYPHQVISTVAMGRNPLITADVPQNWYKYQELKNSRSYQPVITSYMGIAKPQL
uniref:Uncharacterized protein n=1 Tax=Glossina austeni TaxID=7395 RepID=A0A1A9UMD8_GLOAU